MALSNVENKEQGSWNFLNRNEQNPNKFVPCKMNNKWSQEKMDHGVTMQQCNNYQQPTRYLGILTFFILG